MDMNCNLTISLGNEQLHESLLRQQQAAYAVPGVDEQEDVQEARKRKNHNDVSEFPGEDSLAVTPYEYPIVILPGSTAALIHSFF